MRPRFSIRWLFVIVTLSAVALYALFVRPTVFANRFVKSIEQRDFEDAYGLFREDPPLIAGRPILPSRSIALLYAEVLPREWSDIWSFQRRILFRVGFQDDSNGRHVEWTEDTEIVANIDGLRGDPDSPFGIFGYF